jgi:hypothetical protein
MYVIGRCFDILNDVIQPLFDCSIFRRRSQLFVGNGFSNQSIIFYGGLLSFYLHDAEFMFFTKIFELLQTRLFTVRETGWYTYPLHFGYLIFGIFTAIFWADLLIARKIGNWQLLEWFLVFWLHIYNAHNTSGFCSYYQQVHRLLCPVLVSPAVPRFFY